MHCKHACTPAQVLYRILLSTTVSPQNPVLRLATSQAFYSTARGRPGSKQRPVRFIPKRDRDDRIRYSVIQLVDDETEKLMPHTSKLIEVLQSIDHKTHFVEQVTADEPNNPNFIPVCRIYNKKLYGEQERERERAQKEKQKQTAKTSVHGMKTIELNWAIDDHDLSHRMGKMKEFLADGRRVEVVLARKKRGRRATKEECEATLQTVRATAKEVDGAKEVKVADGARMGGLMAIMFLGPEIKTNSSREKDEADTDMSPEQHSAEMPGS